MAYAVETVWRAFVLYLDFRTYAEIERHMEAMESVSDAPSAETVSRWAQEGAGTEGYPWEDIRSMTASTRAVSAYKREIDERRIMPWKERQRKIQADLDEAQDLIMSEVTALRNGEKSMLIKELKLADLSKIIQVQDQIQGAEERMLEQQYQYAVILGGIVKDRVESWSRNGQLKAPEALLDLIRQDFERLIAVGGDEREMKKLASSR